MAKKDVGQNVNQMHTFAQDKNGNIYMSAGWGILKYDGDRFQPIKSKLNNIVQLMVDYQDNLIVGTEDKGIAIYNGSGFWYINTNNSKLPFNSIHALFNDDEGNTWANVTFKSRRLVQQAALNDLKDQVQNGGGWQNTSDATPSPETTLRKKIKQFEPSHYFVKIKGPINLVKK